MADGKGSCPSRGTECIEIACTHYDSKREQCVYTSDLDLLEKIKKVLDDILAK